MDARLELIHRLTLPDGRALSEVLPNDEWQERDVFQPILAQDDGLPRHHLCFIQIPRGHAKTFSCAGIAIVEALAEPQTEIIAVAADKDQAGLLGLAVGGQLARNPRLAHLFKATKDLYTVPANGSSIRIMSSDVPSAWGLGVEASRLRIICDELSVWPSPDLYHVMFSTMAKVRDSQMIVITTAGALGSWQEAVKKSAAQTGYCCAPEGPFPMASWIDPAHWERIKEGLPPNVVSRVFDNVWTSEVGGFLEDMTLWDRLADPTLTLTLDGAEPMPWHPPKRKESLVVGVDAGVVHDSFAIVSVSRDPANHEGVAVRAVRIWTPPGKGRAIDFNQPKQYLLDLGKQYDIVTIVYDVYQLHAMMSDFYKSCTYWTQPFSQQQQRNIADSDLLSHILTGRLRHNGDPGLRQHCQNAALQTSPREDTRGRIVKGSGKVDALVALSMACHECLRLNL